MKKREQKNRMRTTTGRRRRKVAATVCCMTLVSGLLLGGCGQKEAKDEAAEEIDTSILVEVASPTTESIALEGEFMGTVEADAETIIIPKVAGEVTATYFEEGDMVQAGDLLFTVDDASAQITMMQAQASLESAKASVNSAQAGEQAAQFNLLYTQAQIEETLGTVDTNQMQLENAVASAKYALKAAEENRELSKEQFGLARDNYDDLEDQLDDLADDARQMEKYAGSLKQVQKNYNSIKSAPDAPGAASVLAGYGLSLSDVGCDANSSREEIALGYIDEMAGADSEYELGVMVSSAESSASGLRSSRSSVDSSKDSVRLNQISAAVSAEIAKDNVMQAEDGKRLAEKMLADYENYTKATILAGANANLAGSNSSLAQAQAGVTQAQAGVKQAQASIQAAQLQLDYTRVTSPVTGIITQKNVQVHNMASSASSAYVIATEDSINVTFFVSEKVMKALSEGQSIQVERNGEEYTAVITENPGVADAGSGLFKVKAQITGGSELITGTSVKITLATERADNVLTVPVDSVYYESKTAYVYCMDGNRAVKTVVETGITDNEQVEIVSGLTADSKIIVNWASQLRDGSEVKLKEAAEPQATKTEETGTEDTDAEPENAGKEDAAKESEAASAEQDIYVTAGASRIAETAMAQQ